MISRSVKVIGASALALGTIASFSATAYAAPLNAFPDLKFSIDSSSSDGPVLTFGEGAAVIPAQGAGIGFSGITGGFWLRLPGINWNAPPPGYCGPYGFSAAGLYKCNWMRVAPDWAGGRRWYAHSYWGNGYQHAPNDGY